MEQPPAKPEKVVIPGIAVDGARVRSIREAKKLTQLYVASVVGVTTDTISRWENNRYPSIKRDNAEKLAQALEVDLTEIVRTEEVEEKEAETRPPPPAPSTARIWLVCAATLALLLAGAYFFVFRPAPPPTAVRWAPHFAAPGSVVPLQIRITRKQGDTSGFILKERLPEGFRLAGAIPPSSAADSSGSSVKWLIHDGRSAVTVSYTLQASATAPQGSEAKLNGEIVLRTGDANRTESISGSDRIRIGAYHWADTNGDGRIDDDEIMPAYYVCEEMKGLNLDWKTIEDIWSGKGYRWDPQRGYTVLK